MEILAYQLELGIASLHVLLIILAMVVCIRIMAKSSDKLKKSFLFFFLALIPFLFYTIGRIINIETRFTLGKSLSLTFNALTTGFILMGLIAIDKLFKEISTGVIYANISKNRKWVKTMPKDREMPINKTEEKTDETKISKAREIEEPDFLINAIKRFKKSELLKRYPKFSKSHTIFLNWLVKNRYGKDEKDICQKLGMSEEDFEYNFNKYK